LIHLIGRSISIKEIVIRCCELIFIFLLLSIVLIQAARETYHGHQVVRLNISNVPQAHLVVDLIEKYNLDVWSESLNDIRLPPHLRTIFTDLGIEQRIYIQDVQKLIDENEYENKLAAANDDFFNAYRTTNEVNQWIIGLVANYPNLLTLQSIGTTVQNKPIYAVHLRSDKGSDKPRIVFNSAQHAREWVTITTINYVLNEMVTGYGTNPVLTNLVDKIDWTFIPITNVDGYDFSWGSRMWRKTRKVNPGSTCIGVDPNRNWVHRWNNGGSSSNPCSDIFHGPSAGSEPEPRAVANFLRDTPRVRGYIDIHSYSQLFMCPWGYTAQFPPHYQQMMALINPIVSAIQAKHGRRYTAGSIGSILYIASGSAVDYGYGALNIIHSYTIELRDTGQYGFILPPNQIIPQGEEFLAGVIVMGEAIHTEYINEQQQK